MDFAPFFLFCISTSFVSRVCLLACLLACIALRMYPTMRMGFHFNATTVVVVGVDWFFFLTLRFDLCTFCCCGYHYLCVGMLTGC